MKNMHAFRPLIVLVFICWSGMANALISIPSVNRVVDLTNTLTTQQQNEISASLKQFEAQKGTQIGVLIIPTTQPETIEQFGMRLAQDWKLGRKKIDDGAILIIAKQDRTMRIEVGYGLEGALNDAVSKRIISEIITPYFQKGDFNGGIVAGLNQMMKVIMGEPLPSPSQKPVAMDDVFNYAFIILFICIYICSLLKRNWGDKVKIIPTSTALGAIAGGVVYGFTFQALIAIGLGFLAFVLALFFLKSGIILGGGRGGNGFGGGRGDGGGGFSGGGGGFGGGGASGKW